MDPLDAALLFAWNRHVLPRLGTAVGRAELAHRLAGRPRKACGPRYAGDTPRSHPRTPIDIPLRRFALCLRANDRRIPDHNTAGAVLLDAAEVQRLCAPVPLPPPGVPRATAAHLLGVGASALTGRVRSGQLLKHQPHPRASTRSGKYPGDPPRAHVYYHAPPPHHLIDPAGDIQSADWAGLAHNLHLRPRNLSSSTSSCFAGDAQRPPSPDETPGDPSAYASASGAGDGPKPSSAPSANSARITPSPSTNASSGNAPTATAPPNASTGRSAP